MLIPEESKNNCCPTWNLDALTNLQNLACTKMSIYSPKLLAISVYQVNQWVEFRYFIDLVPIVCRRQHQLSA